MKSQKKDFLAKTTKPSLEEREFQVYFQPKINLQESKVSSAEALSRLILPDGHVMMPGNYIPHFEKNGLIKEFDFYILEEVCDYLSRWKKVYRDMLDPLPISVNFSRSHFTDPSFIDSLQETLNRYDVPAHLIEVEITETLAIQNIAEFNNVIHNLHELGVKCALDDFGVNQSSLSILKDIDIDILKIDRSFLVGNDNNHKKAIILKTIIELARNLEITSVAEGAETKIQVDYLKEFGCDEIQGWYFSHALPEEQFTEYVLQKNLDQIFCDIEKKKIE